MVDKPAGRTSHDVVDTARRALGIRRVGHGGTLDPFATGLLPLLIGRATRLMPYIVGLDKRYTGTIRLGSATHTHDLTGTVTASAPWETVTDDALTAAMAALTGRSLQRPPDFSAKKVGGRPAHRRARRGEPVDLAPREVEVTEFRLIQRDGPDVTFETHVSSGTYIRALARDLGDALGCGAHLRSLRRTAIGTWTVDQAVPFDTLRAGAATVRPPAEAVTHLPTRTLGADEWHAVQHGRPLLDDTDWGAPAVALLAGDALVAVAEPRGPRLQPRVVLDA